MPARLRTTYRHSQAGGSPRRILVQPDLNSAFCCFFCILHRFSATAYTLLQTHLTRNIQYEVTGMAHIIAQGGTEERALELSGCYLETFAAGWQEPGGFAGCAAYLASSEPRDPPCPRPPRAPRSTCTSSCSKSAAARWPEMVNVNGRLITREHIVLSLNTNKGVQMF